jgi:hypothetical protein
LIKGFPTTTTTTTTRTTTTKQNVDPAVHFVYSRVKIQLSLAICHPQIVAIYGFFLRQMPIIAVLMELKIHYLPILAFFCCEQPFITTNFPNIPLPFTLWFNLR